MVHSPVASIENNAMLAAGKEVNQQARKVNPEVRKFYVVK
jgi:hypothetical protein